MGQQTQAILLSVAQPVHSIPPQAVVSRSLAVQSEVRGGGGSVATAIGDLADITCSSLMSDPASKKMLSTCEFDDWHHTHAVWPEHTAQACRMIAI